jgi:hypothetical protein
MFNIVFNGYTHNIIECIIHQTWDGYIAVAKKLNTVLRPHGIEGVHLTILQVPVILLTYGIHIYGCLAVRY